MMTNGTVCAIAICSCALLGKERVRARYEHFFRMPRMYSHISALFHLAIQPCRDMLCRDMLCHGWCAEQQLALFSFFFFFPLSHPCTHPSLSLLSLSLLSLSLVLSFLLSVLAHKHTEPSNPSPDHPSSASVAPFVLDPSTPTDVCLCIPPFLHCPL